MDSATDHQWFLRKHEDGTVFGPLDFAHLAHWASSAQVAPNDAVSPDQLTWMKAPMLPELGMDWIVELTSERYYGPTTLGAINEFIHLGEINPETFVINACDGSRRQIHDIAALLEAEPSASDTNAESATASGPAASGMAVGVQDRIRELEEALRDERRALTEAEERYRYLESKYLELLNSRSTL